MIMIRDFSNMFQQMSGMPINSKGGKAMLKKYGIDTNSAQYKAAMKQMSQSAGGGVGGIPQSQRHKIISVSEKSRQDMFDETKRHFLQGNGVGNGDTTRRSEVFTRYQLSVPKSDRLKGTWTLGQYERAYRQAFYDACKNADPKWEIGKDIPAGALNGITRESIDNVLIKGHGEFGETLERKSLNISL